VLTSIHILLTYTCSLKCDHCYVYASPKAHGKYTSPKLTRLLEQISVIRSIEWIIFEGGEPFLVFPLLLMSVKRAKRFDFKVGIITNGYFGRSEEAAIRYLKPLVTLGVDRIYISNDQFHYKLTDNSPAKKTIDAAVKLGIPTTRMKIGGAGSSVKGPIQDLGYAIEETHPLMLVGRAAERIKANPQTNVEQSYNCCPLKNLEDPETIFIDPFGNAQFCQGISIGNVWLNPLKGLLEQLDINTHPIYGPIVRNGPQGLVEEYDLVPLLGYQDACHQCYSTRRMLVDRFPKHLTPPQLYNLQL
jgi:hypothetical protein